MYISAYLADEVVLDIAAGAVETVPALVVVVELGDDALAVEGVRVLLPQSVLYALPASGAPTQLARAVVWNAAARPEEIVAIVQIYKKIVVS